MNLLPKQCILTINGGSSTIKFALFEATDPVSRKLSGAIEGVGQSEGRLITKGRDQTEAHSRPVVAADHLAAVGVLVDWIQKNVEADQLIAIGHRIVHGGPKYWEPQRITPAMIDELHELSPFDPEHLPEEILLTEAFHRRFPELPQIACFDTAFHHDLPRVAQLLPLPRRFEAKGVRRYGFHGLSCAYLMQELERLAGPSAAQGRVVLAHLGNGASVTAVAKGKSLDTSMSFTPAAGLPMGTRSGDIDPGLAWYLSRAENVTAKQFNHMINHESGLLGVSETSSDMRELLLHEKLDTRAADAVALFCYQTKKWICALSGALEGLDTLVFAGGIGENGPEIRARICRSLRWLGIKFDERRNAENAALISSDDSPVSVRVIRTDEELMIATSVARVLGGTQR